MKELFSKDHVFILTDVCYKCKYCGYEVAFSHFRFGDKINKSCLSKEEKIIKDIIE